MLENAKKEADKNAGYKVYNSAGELVYDPKAVTPEQLKKENEELKAENATLKATAETLRSENAALSGAIAAVKAAVAGV